MSPLGAKNKRKTVIFQTEEADQDKSLENESSQSTISEQTSNEDKSFSLEPTEIEANKIEID